MDLSSVVQIVLCDDVQEYCKKFKESSLNEHTEITYIVDLSHSNQVLNDQLIFEKLQITNVVLVLTGLLDDKSMDWFHGYLEQHNNNINWSRLKIVVIARRCDLYLLQENYHESFIPIVGKAFKEDWLKELEISPLSQEDVVNAFGKHVLNLNKYRYKKECLRYMNGIKGLKDVLRYRHFLHIYLHKLPEWIEKLKVARLELKGKEKVKEGCVRFICRELLNEWYVQIAEQEKSGSEKKREWVSLYRVLSEEIAGAMKDFSGSLSREQMLVCLEQGKDQLLLRRCLRGVALSLREVGNGKFEFRMQGELLLNYLVSERKRRLKQNEEQRIVSLLFDKPLKISEVRDNDEDWIRDPLNVRELSKDELEEYAEKLVREKSSKLYFWGWVYRSRKGKEYVNGGRHAITILNYSRESFEGIDLRGINVKRADLNSGNFKRAKFGFADLRYVNLSNSDVSGADFTSTKMKGVNFGQFPQIVTKETIGFAFSKDLNFAASFHLRGVVRLWDVRTCSVLGIFQNPRSIQNVCITPDGEYVAVRMALANVILWRKNRRKCVQSFCEYDSFEFVEGGNETTMTDARDGSKISYTSIKMNPSKKTAISYDGKYIIFCELDKLYLCDKDGIKEEFGEIKDHIFRRVDMSHDGNVIISACKPGLICVWDRESRNIIWSKLIDYEISFIYLDKYGTHYVMSCNNVVMYGDVKENLPIVATFNTENNSDLPSSQELANFRKPQVIGGVTVIKGSSFIHSLTFSEDAIHIGAFCKDGKVVIIDTQANSKSQFTTSATNYEGSITFSSDFLKVAVLDTPNDILKIFRIEDLSNTIAPSDLRATDAQILDAKNLEAENLKLLLQLGAQYYTRISDRKFVWKRIEPKKELLFLFRDCDIYTSESNDAIKIKFDETLDDYYTCASNIFFFILRMINDGNFPEIKFSNIKVIDVSDNKLDDTFAYTLALLFMLSDLKVHHRISFSIFSRYKQIVKFNLNLIEIINLSDNSVSVKGLLALIEASIPNPNWHSLVIGNNNINNRSRMYQGTVKSTLGNLKLKVFGVVCEACLQLDCCCALLEAEIEAELNFKINSKEASLVFIEYESEHDFIDDEHRSLIVEYIDQNGTWELYKFEFIVDDDNRNISRVIVKHSKMQYLEFRIWLYCGILGSFFPLIVEIQKAKDLIAYLLEYSLSNSFAILSRFSKASEFFTNMLITKFKLDRNLPKKNPAVIPNMDFSDGVKPNIYATNIRKLGYLSSNNQSRVPESQLLEEDEEREKYLNLDSVEHFTTLADLLENDRRALNGDPDADTDSNEHWSPFI